MDGWTRGRGSPPPRKSILERTWWKLASITGLRSTPGYQTSPLSFSLRRSTQILAWIESISPKEATAENGPRANFLGTVCDFSLCTLPCVIPFLPFRPTIVPGPPKGKTSAYIQTEGKYRRASGSQRDDVYGAGILASVYLSIGDIVPSLYTLSLLTTRLFFFFFN